MRTRRIIEDEFKLKIGIEDQETEKIKLEVLFDIRDLLQQLVDKDKIKVIPKQTVESGTTTEGVPVNVSKAMRYT